MNIPPPPAGFQIVSGNSAPPPPSGFQSQSAPPFASTSGTRQPRGIRNNNPGNIEDGPFARSLPGYAGSDGRFARFNDASQGEGAQVALLGRYAQRGQNTPRSIIFGLPDQSSPGGYRMGWAGPHENDSQSYATYVANRLGIGLDDQVPQERLGDVALAIREFENGLQPGPVAQPVQQTAMTPPEGFELQTEQPQTQAPLGSSRDNPINLAELTNDSVQRLRQGAWVTNPQTGETYALPGDAWFGAPDSSSERVGNNAYIDRPDVGDTALAFGTALSEQIPFGDELVAAGAGALSGRGYDAIREQQATERELLNQTNRGARNAGGLAGFGAGFFVPGGKFIEGAQGAARIGRAAAIGGGYGALYGAGNTDGGLEERLAAAATQGALGAGAGSIIQRGADAIGAAARNARANPSAARQLSAAGVDLTLGQMMGGFAQRLEDASTSVPVLGDAVRDARRRGLETFNNAAINRALEPIGATSTQGRQGIQQADQAVSDAYSSALQGVQVPRDSAFDAQITQIARTNPLPGELQPQFNALLNNALNRIGQGLDGQSWKQLDSELAAAVRSSQSGSQTNPIQRLMAVKLDELRGAVRGLLDRAAPNVSAAIGQADAAAAGMYRIRDAGQSLGTSAREGIFTPGDLNRAVRNGDSSAGNRQFARGQAMMQDLSDAATQVLPSTVPDSGTALRSLFTVAPALGAGGAAGAVGVPVAGPAALMTGAGLFGGAAAYSRPVQGVINRAYRASTPGAARQALSDLQRLAAQTPVLQPVYEALQSALRPLLLGGPTATPTTQ